VLLRICFVKAVSLKLYTKRMINLVHFISTFFTNLYSVRLCDWSVYFFGNITLYARVFICWHLNPLLESSFLQSCSGLYQLFIVAVSPDYPSGSDPNSLRLPSDGVQTSIISYFILIVLGFFSSGTIRSMLIFSMPSFRSAPVTSMYSPRANDRVNLRPAIPL